MDMFSLTSNLRVKWYQSLVVSLVLLTRGLKQVNHLIFGKEINTMYVTTEDAISIAKQIGYRGVVEELRLGIEEEAAEHAKTHKLINDRNSLNFFAGLIAQDHLKEDPQYYTKERKLKLLARNLGNTIAYDQMHHR